MRNEMVKEVKEDIQLMAFPTALPSLAKKSAFMQIPTDRVLASIQETYARIENHRASSAQKDTENVY